MKAGKEPAVGRHCPLAPATFLTSLPFIVCQSSRQAAMTLPPAQHRPLTTTVPPLSARITLQESRQSTLHGNSFLTLPLLQPCQE